MNLPTTALFRACLLPVAFALPSLALAAPSGAADATLPDSLRPGYEAPIVGPADDRAYSRGELGLVQPGFGRASLYVAWRVMHLPVAALANESHQRRGDWLHGVNRPAEPSEDEIAAWLRERGKLVAQMPAVAPTYFRPGKTAFSIETGQCGPDAYALATRTLRDLEADTALNDAGRKAWILAQDDVFARCGWPQGKQPAPALPAALASDAPAKLKALNDYQRAASLFYGDDYEAARQAFDAIAARPDHPMRPFAVLGALRTIVRDAVRDTDWDAAVDDAWNRRGLRGAAFNAAIADAVPRHNARVAAALKAYEPRSIAARADATLAAVHPAIDYTSRRALLQLAPAYPLAGAMNSLDRPEFNPYTMGTLDLFQELYPRLSPDRPQGAIATALRRHAWFDFVVSVQACSNAPAARNADACDAEHAHALARWQETKDNAWLLAALMTARVPASADLAAADAARAVPAERPEWASLQFYAARVLRAQGRGAEARAAIEMISNTTVIHKRDRALLEAERRASSV